MPALLRRSPSPPSPRPPPRGRRPPRRAGHPAGAAHAHAVESTEPALEAREIDEPGRDFDAPDGVDDDTDAAPRRRATAEERAAFEAAALPHRRELYGAALRLTRSPADADDLVQETLMRALAAWPSFVIGSNCRAWLHRIQTNTFISGYRRRRRHHRFASETGDDAARALYGARLERSRDPRAEVGARALGDEVVAALEGLHEDYRAVVALADLEGVRYREIAQRLGIPIGTVMSRLFRARRLLEEQLRGYAAEQGVARGG